MFQTLLSIEFARMLAGRRCARQATFSKHPSSFPPTRPGGWFGNWGDTPQAPRQVAVGDLHPRFATPLADEEWQDVDSLCGMNPLPADRQAQLPETLESRVSTRG